MIPSERKTTKDPLNPGSILMRRGIATHTGAPQMMRVEGSNDHCLKDKDRIYIGFISIFLACGAMNEDAPRFRAAACVRSGNT